ncbi:MAG TPA: hypothetical protein EYN91_04365 [Candidatus Melainabacteria bacterium]|nr:hypothetical protein [Candidatus Melainabacteria bacterium]HIN66176.1 hypothetical protein [Candidatus Obscuribacterales bacterium]
MAKSAAIQEDDLQDSGIFSKECPQCGKVKDVDTEFGYRLSKGRTIAQSWCRECRGVSAVLGPSKKWDGFSESIIKQKIEEKRELFRKPAKEKKSKQQEKQAAIAGAVIKNNPRTGFSAIKKEAKNKGLTVRQVLGEDPITKQAPKKLPPAEVKTVTPTPVPEDDKVIWLSADIGSTNATYSRFYPDDTFAKDRPWKLKIKRLMKKLGDRARLTQTAKERLGL